MRRYSTNKKPGRFWAPGATFHRDKNHTLFDQKVKVDG